MNPGGETRMEERGVRQEGFLEEVQVETEEEEVAAGEDQGKELYGMPSWQPTRKDKGKAVDLHKQYQNPEDATSREGVVDPILVKLLQDPEVERRLKWLRTGAGEGVNPEVERLKRELNVIKQSHVLSSGSGHQIYPGLMEATVHEGLPMERQGKRMTEAMPLQVGPVGVMRARSASV